MTITISDLCRLNMEASRANNRETSLQAYDSHRRLFELTWGSRLAADLTRDEALAWVRERKTQVAMATCRHELAFIKRAFNLGIDRGVCDTNPFARLGGNLKIGKRHQWFTSEEEAAMHAAYRKLFPLGDLWWTVERFNFLTGCRIGEQAYLQPRHISKKVLTIPDEGKTGRRLVPLHEEAYAIAQLWMGLSKAMCSPWVFFPVAGDRHRIANRWSVDVWLPARKLAGLEDRQRRDERRTYGTNLIRMGTPIYDVQKLLGHTNTRQTETYCQVDLLHLSGSVAKLR